MGKSAAEKMREYRKRLKEDTHKYEVYLAKAKERKKQNYVPVNQLTISEKKRRREKNKKDVRNHRQRKREERDENVHPDANESTTLAVNMPFPNRGNGPRKRVQRALSRKHRELKVLQLKFENLEKKYRKNMRCLQRMKKKQKDQIQQNSTTSTPDVQCTPRRKTEELLVNSGFTRRQRNAVRKQLLFANVMQSELDKGRRRIKRTERGLLCGLIGGKIISKYRLARAVGRSTGLGRKNLGHGNKQGENMTSLTDFKQRRRRREIEKYRSLVIEFFTRDDNSRCNPGKQDKVKMNGKNHQTRLLTDYLKNLYIKFKSENPDVKLSFTSFSRIRPANIKLTRFISRSCCLCTKHQNFALCTTALRKNGVNLPLNPERFIEDEENISKMKNDLPEEIEFGQWKRVAVEDKGKKKMIMRVVSRTMTKTEFVTHMEEQITEFSAHVQRVRRQYEESLQIKKHLPENEVIVNMDFAENYSCRSVNEIQSAYWNQCAVTLHPVVIYHKNDKGDLQHKSMIIISDELGHNSSTVLTFVDRIVPEVKKLVSPVQKIHYYTDSPTSQYRNKTIFRLVANHENIYGCKAVWNYFEAGHGKGPCDGLGGTTKRMADEAVNSGKVAIQDAEEFYRWSQSGSCSLKSVMFLYVPSSDCQKKTKDISCHDIKAVKGTMKVHAVVGKGNETILISPISCYCNDCISGQTCSLTQWMQETLVVHDKSDGVENEQESLNENHTEVPEKANPPSPSIELVVGNFVAALYERKVYIGKVLDIDDEDDEIEITFMENVRSLLQWPKNEDRLWVRMSAIICILSDPIPTRKSKRMFKLCPSDLAKIEDQNFVF